MNTTTPKSNTTDKENTKQDKPNSENPDSLTKDKTPANNDFNATNNAADTQNFTQNNNTVNNYNTTNVYRESSDDLAKKKHAADNEFNATGNIGGTQFFFQNAYFGDKVNSYSVKNAVNIAGFTDESYDLREANDCAKFGERYKSGEYFALAIILCTFEVVSIGDLPDLKTKLIERLPVAKVLNDDGKEVDISKQDPYLSLNSMLAVVGGKLFTTEDGQRCTGFGEGSEKALINVWEQFPSLRNPIVSWLINVSETYEYRTTFDAYQITTAFSRVISMDFVDAKRRIFPRLYSNPNNVGLLGALAYELHKEPNYREEILALIYQWINSDSNWLWKSACFVYSYFDGEYVYNDFDKYLKKIIAKRLSSFSISDLSFIPWLICYSKRARSMLAYILYETFRKANNRNKQIEVASAYILLVKYCYYLVDSNLTELPLVACDTREQQHNLKSIISQVMSIYNLRQQFYAILGAYLKEISSYDLSTVIRNHISAFFHNIVSSSPDFQNDVLFFLKKCKGNVAKQIYDKLYSYYYSSVGGLLE